MAAKEDLAVVLRESCKHYLEPARVHDKETRRYFSGLEYALNSVDNESELCVAVTTMEPYARTPFQIHYRNTTMQKLSRGVALTAVNLTTLLGSFAAPAPYSTISMATLVLGGVTMLAYMSKAVQKIHQLELINKTLMNAKLPDWRQALMMYDEPLRGQVSQYRIARKQ